MIPTISHKELVAHGAKWLNKNAPNVFYRCQFVCTELTCAGTKEIPDIVGIRSTGNILIEVKVSRADFKRDHLKKGRSGEFLQIGKKRLYLAPKGLLNINEIPESWGLLEWDGRDIEIKKHSEDFLEDKNAINFIYYSVIRRTNKPQVFDFKKKTS